MFPDLRSFISQLRRDRDLVEVAAPVDAHLEVAEIHRRVIAAGGPALLFTNVQRRGVPPRHQPVRHGAARRARLRRRGRSRSSGASSTSPRPCCRRRPASSGARATSPASCCKVGSTRRRSRSGHRGREPPAAPRPPAGAHLLAGGRRPVRHPAARLHRAPGRQGPRTSAMYRLHVHDARTTGMHWQIGKGGGFHYAGRRRRAARRCR